jgi:hypothetical protein
LPEVRAMNPTDIKTLIREHFAAAGHDEIAAGEIFADDVVIEWPQSGERFRGKSDVIAMHQAAPVNVAFEIRRTIGCVDLWVTEATIRYDGARPTHAVIVMELHDGKVVRETDYFGDPFDPPAYRSRWAESIRDEER